MQITDLIQPETVTVVTGIGAAVSIGRSIVVFKNSSEELGKTLRKQGRRIEKLSAGMPQTREKVAQLEKEIGPLKETLHTINLYFDRINEVWMAAERKEVRAEQEEAGDRSVTETPETGRRPPGKT